MYAKIIFFNILWIAKYQSGKYLARKGHLFSTKQKSTPAGVLYPKSKCFIGSMYAQNMAQIVNHIFPKQLGFFFAVVRKIGYQ